METMHIIHEWVKKKAVRKYTAGQVKELLIYVYIKRNDTIVAEHILSLIHVHVYFKITYKWKYLIILCIKSKFS